MDESKRNDYLHDFTSHVLRRVHSQVNVFVRASTGGDLIKEPDQAQGFPKDILSSIVITILRELLRRANGMLTHKGPILACHGFPFPAAAVASCTGREKAVDRNHPAATLCTLYFQQTPEGAQ